MDDYGSPGEVFERHFPLAQWIADFRLDITGAVHVGAHEGQEAAIYARNGISNVTWIEADPRVLPRLREHVSPMGHRAIGSLVSDRSGCEVDFHITNNEMSSSILRLGTHRQEHPGIVVTESIRLVTSTLDELCERECISNFNMLTIDVQGAELLVLRGADRVLAGVDHLVLEVNERPLYEGCALVSELDAHLGDFRRVRTVMTAHGWGDALYVRKKVLRRAQLHRWTRRPISSLRRRMRFRTRLRALIRGA